MEYQSILQGQEYNFLKTDEHLGKNVILLGLAGSYSYGTNNENSDIDVRGVTLNRKSDLIGLTSYEQYVDDKTDTTIYTFNKMISLLLSCNPNTVELLGLNEEHYLFLNDLGRELIANTKLFLSKRAIQSFGGYADAQLRRLENALARDSYSQSEKEKHIFNSVKNAMHLVRLFMMAIDILEKGEIHTHRSKEQELLLSIRRGDYQREDGGFCEAFYDIVSEYEKKLDYAAANTDLPDEPDLEAVQEYVMKVNEKIIKDEQRRQI